MNTFKLIDNQYYHNQFPRTLVLAPHPDDEINLSANLIHSITMNKGNVFIAFSNNGDWSVSAKVRMTEARNSLQILGVEESNIFFLGYGDTWFSGNANHFYYHEDGTVSSKAGYTQTYAGDGFIDYAFQRHGKHSLYNVSDFCADLYDLILFLKPELLICVDYDEHPDHRVLSLCFEKTMGRVLKENPNYHPEVLKRLAYPLAYCAEEDYQINNPSTKQPMVGSIERYNSEIIGHNILQWNSRIRLPISKEAMNGIGKGNVIEKALKCHRSQFIYGKAGRIINGDEVYWQRRTDNVAYFAELEASSGDPHYVNDFQLIKIIN